MFGYGALTWEWVHGIRSYAHVLPFALLFLALRILGLDTPAAVAHGPRALQALISAASDICLFNFAERHMCAGAGWDALLCSLTSWFVWYCGVRTYSSCMEAALVSAALAQLPAPDAQRRDGESNEADGDENAIGCAMGDGKATPAGTTRQGSLVRAAACGALAIAIRPTAALVVLPLACFAMLSNAVSKPEGTARRSTTRQSHGRATCGTQLAATAAAIVVFALALLVDRLCHGTWLVPALAFFRFNVASDGAAYYGTHPWHWYLTAAIPVALGTHLPLVARGLYVARGWARAPALAAACACGVLSLAQHKELRFVYPLVHPLLLCYAGLALNRLPQGRRRAWFATLTVSNALPAAYLSLVHQRAPLELMAELRKELAVGRLEHVDLLIRCHQTPAFAQIHSDVRLTMLHCPPPTLAQATSPQLDSIRAATSPPHSAEPGTSTHTRDVTDASMPWLATRSELRGRYPFVKGEACANDCDCFFVSPGLALMRRYSRRSGHRLKKWLLRMASWKGVGARRPFEPSHIVVFDELLLDVPGTYSTLHALGYVVHRRFVHELIWVGCRHSFRGLCCWPQLEERIMVLMRRV